MDNIENKYCVNELVKYDYSDIGEFVDETHTGRPLRNDQIVELLNNQNKIIKELDKYCVAQEDTLTTILEYVDALLNGLDIQDCFIQDYFEIIKSLDLERMNKIIMEIKSNDR